MKSKITFLILMTLVVSSEAATIIVDTNGFGDYTNIQEAIDNSTNGDEIIVREGTYYETINLLGKSITLRSTIPSDPNVIVNTVIDANDNTGQTMRCWSGEDQNTIIEGFTITRSCDASGDGGLMICIGTSPTVKNCTFAGRGFSAGHGGGFCCKDGGSPKLIDCIFIDNTALLYGGGIACLDSSITVETCSFIDNTAVYGGGIRCLYGGEKNLTNCTFIGNKSAYNGGGIYLAETGPSTVVNCNFTYNKAGIDGGGIYCRNSNLLLTNCSFNSNDANYYGGGLRCQDASPILNNCKFVRNIATHLTSSKGAGMFCYGNSNPELNNCIFIGNESTYNGGGIFCEHSSSSPVLSETIVCGNKPNQIVGDFTDNGGNIIGNFPPPIPPLSGYRGDLNGDGKVDFADFAIFADKWLLGVE